MQWLRFIPRFSQLTRRSSWWSSRSVSEPSETSPSHDATPSGTAAASSMTISTGTARSTSREESSVPAPKGQKVKATVILEFESGHKEAVAIDDLLVLGSFKSSFQSRPIYEVVHPNVNGVYQHHNVGVALLDLLRVAILDLNPAWCKSGPGNFDQLARPTKPEMTADMARQLEQQSLRMLGASEEQVQQVRGPGTDFSEIDKVLKETNQQEVRCLHERLNEDGICRKCGADCRGAY